MKPKKFELSLAPIDRAYAPGYPRTLGAEEYAALLVPRTRERLLALWGAACAALAVSASCGDGADRETSVVELLQREADAHRVGYSWLWMSSMQALNWGPDASEHVYVPNIPISFGNSSMGLFDAGSARKLAGEIFHAYGLELESGVVLETPLVHARLDGADRARKIGFKLRGLVGKHEMGDVGEAEPAATDLDPVERVELEKDGWKLHVADARYYPLMDGDQLTPTLAYLCGVVEFLNSVTDGPDLDLRSVLLGQRQHFPVPDLQALGLTGSASKPAGNDDSYQEFELKEPRKLELQFNVSSTSAPSLRSRGYGGSDEKDSALKPPVSTKGRISALQLPVQRCEPWTPRAPGQPEPKPGPVHVTLKQARKAGTPPLVIEAWNELLFTPSGFDAAMPFDLEIELQPGKYLLKSGLEVSVLRE